MNSRCMLRFLDRARLLVLVLTLSTTFIVAGCSHNEADADRLATMLQVRPGMVVADVGAGKGRMTVVMATLVGPKGHVYSTEIDPRALGQIRDAVKAADLDNVTVVQATASDPGLPADCCDAIFLSRVYHHLTDPTDTDRSLFQALRRGGQLAVLDFRPSIFLWPWMPKGLPPNREGHGIGPVTVAEEVKHAGFEYVGMEDPWPGSWFLASYCLLFKKPPQSGGNARPASSPKDGHGALASPPQ
jgi:ubiquinone/menaquinone biosynthesis C-methylase UbiE